MHVAHRPVRRSKPRRRTAAVLTAALLVLAGCAGGAAAPAADGTPDGTPTPTTAGGPLVVATTTVLGEVAHDLLGDAGEVVTLMPPGADPHTFQPSAQQVAQLQEADLVVMNGAGLEEGLSAAIDEAHSAGVELFTAVDHVDALSAEDGAGHGDETRGDGETHGDDETHEAEETHGDGDVTDEDHAGEEVAGAHAQEGTVDPHIWMDPERLADVTRALGDRLADAGVEAGVQQRAADHAEEFEALSDEVATTLAAVPDDARVLITNHDALAYFADRYDFRIAGTVIPGLTTGAEPSAEDIENLARTVDDTGVNAIFAESTVPGQLAQTVAGEVGRPVEVVELYTGSLGEPDSPAGTYTDMMTTNAQRIANALGG